MTGAIPASYWRDARRWTGWGILAIVPLLGALWLMIAKPIKPTAAHQTLGPDPLLSIP